MKHTLRCQHCGTTDCTRREQHQAELRRVQRATKRLRRVGQDYLQQTVTIQGYSGPRTVFGANRWLKGAFEVARVS